MDRYLFSETPVPVSLADLRLPWRPLTRPARALDVSFRDAAAGRGRQALVRMDVVADGVLNAVVSWFDLHLDDDITVSSLPPSARALIASRTPGVPADGGGGTVPEDAPAAGGPPGGAGRAGPAAASEPSARDGGPRPGAALQAGAPGPGCCPNPGQGRPGAAARGAGGAAGARGPATAERCAGLGGRVAATLSAGEGAHPAAAPAGGARPGGARPGGAVAAPPVPAGARGGRGKRARQGKPGGRCPQTPQARAVAIARGERPPPPRPARGAPVPGPRPPAPGGEATLALALAPPPAAAPAPAGPPPLADPEPGSHWGQALHPMDRLIKVRGGRKVTVLASRDAAKLSFALRPGVGVPAPRAPWHEGWGGGSSVENPHVQRVKYCELLVQVRHPSPANRAPSARTLPSPAAGPPPAPRPPRPPTSRPPDLPAPRPPGPLGAGVRPEVQGGAVPARREGHGDAVRALRLPVPRPPVPV